MSQILQGKVALITGAASGIGAETARCFHRAGAQIVVSDINRRAGEALAAELGALFVAADVSDEIQVAEAVRATVARYGRLDVMINNAGMVGVVGSLLDTEVADWRRTLAVLLDSVFFGIKHAGRQMREQANGGVILSLSSLAGVVGGVGPHVYSVAKSGVVALTRGAASELAQYGIRVNAVSPGLVVTPLVEQVYGDRQAAEQGSRRNSPLGRPAYPSEVAETLLFLASDAGAQVSAHNLVMDSGVSAAGAAGLGWQHNVPPAFIGKQQSVE